MLKSTRLLEKEVDDGSRGRTGCNFSWFKLGGDDTGWDTQVRKCDLVVLISWPVENRWIFKEQVLTFSSC